MLACHDVCALKHKRCDKTGLRDLEPELAVALGLIEETPDPFGELRGGGPPAAGGLQKAQGAPGLGRHAAQVEGQGKVEGEEVGLLAPPEVEKHGGFVRTGQSGDVLEAMTAEAGADLAEHPGRVLVPAAASEDLALDPADAQKALRVVRERLAEVALEQQPPCIGELAGIDEGKQKVVVGRGDQLRVPVRQAPIAGGLSSFASTS